MINESELIFNSSELHETFNINEQSVLEFLEKLKRKIEEIIQVSSLNFKK